MADKEMKLWSGYTTTNYEISSEKEVHVIKEEMIDEAMRLHVFPS